MRLFHRINLAARAAVYAAIAVGMWSLWQRREVARPLVDAYAVWHGVRYEFPEPLPRMKVTVLRCNSDSSVSVRAADGTKWNFGFAAFAPAFSAEGLEIAPDRSFYTNRFAQMKHDMVGRELEIGYTVLSQGTGLGFFYDGTNLVDREWIAEGLRPLNPEAARVLPLREQYRLRLADRSSREEHRGGWKFATNAMAVAAATSNTVNR